MDGEIFTLGASSLDESTGAAKWQSVVPITSEEGDTENLGETDVFQSLGVTSRPYPKDETGYAEGFGLRNCAGRSLVCVGGRDTRSAKIAAGLKPGDVCLHSTGPQQASQVRCTEEKRQVILASKDSKKRSMMLVIDGKNDKIQIAAMGAMIEIDPTGDVSIANGGGASILLQGADIYMNGTVHLPGMKPGHALMMGPLTGTPNTLSTPIPLFPVLAIGK
jgi:hypothetical protein